MPFYRLMRPKQWIKNLLIFVVPFLSGKILDPDVIQNSLIGFVSFCAASSGIYVLNDLRDAEQDRNHPKKQLRPIASGLVTPIQGLSFAVALISVSLILPSYFIEMPAAVPVAVYLAIQLTYVLGMKNLAIVELVFVASGFVIRSLAGGQINDIPISIWFLTVVSSAALFIVAGKRYNELKLHGHEVNSRIVLRDYTVDYLRSIWTSFMTSTIVFYCIWAVEMARDTGRIVPELSSIPFALLLLKYGQLIDRGSAETPEDALLNNRSILALSLSWVFFMALYVVSGF